MNLEEWLTQSAADLAEAETELEAAQQKVDELRTMHEGLLLAKQRYGQEDQAAPQVPQGRTSRTPSGTGRKTKRKTVRRPQRGHSDLCYQVLLDSASREFSSVDAREVLAEQGHELDAEQVRNGFAYLVRKGLVDRVDNGLWALKASAEDDSHTPDAHDVEPGATPQPVM